ncbi:MAG: asparagine synthase (glutamine-hydrolyzing) [Geminicoccaceae bacterium]
MCGICGFLLMRRDLPPAELAAVVDAMARTLRHRGPDDAGRFVDIDAGLAFGHRRLSIIDLSDAGHQPMASACGRFVITYNGEIYNFGDVRQVLEQRGHHFKGHSDTEVLLAAIAEWGIEQALPRLHGMFAFALWDRHARRLTLARDRVGKKPLYYGWCGDAFLFTSELKAVHRHPAFDGEIDRDALGLLIQHGWIPGPYSIYRGIRKLPPGAILSVRAEAGRREPAIHTWWSAKEVAQAGERAPFAGTFDEAVCALDSRLGDAVRRRMIADVPLGALLSGGVDSSSVVALMQAASGTPVRTFAIGFREPKHDEAPFARQIAAHLRTDHTELYVGPEDSLALVPELPAIYDEPFADPSQIPTALVCRLARGGVTVALSGDGGDELFAGYQRYRRSLDLWRRYRPWPGGVRQAAEAAFAALDDRFAGPKWLSKAAKRSTGLGAADPLDVFVGERTRIEAPARLVRGARATSHLLADRRSWPELAEPLQVMMYLDFAGYLPDDGLVKVDRASMATGLEVRCPLLDHAVVELAWSLPLDHRDGKRVLKAVLERYVPSALFERPKRGFGVPIGAWLRGPLRDWAETLLGERRLAAEGFLEPAAVRALWDQHQSGRRHRPELLWHLLMFQAWHERWRGAPPLEAASEALVAAQR